MCWSHTVSGYYLRDTLFRTQLSISSCDWGCLCFPQSFWVNYGIRFVNRPWSLHTPTFPVHLSMSFILNYLCSWFTGIKEGSAQDLAILNIFQWSLLEQDFHFYRTSGFCARGVWFETDEIYCLYLPQPLITVGLSQLSASSNLFPTSEIH